MRRDQLKRLERLVDKVGEVFLEEADPQRWTAADVPAAQRTAGQRGDRNWDMKNANLAGALFARVLDVRDRLNGRSAAPMDADALGEVEADVKRYEKQAAALVQRIKARQGGPA
jgi:hypothetical protein